MIPAGPQSSAVDVVDSVLLYGGDGVSVVVVDDSPDGKHGPELAQFGLSVSVIPAPSGVPSGLGGRLWFKIAAGLAHLESGGLPDVVLRMDTDALLIGPGFAEAAHRAFLSDPGLGVLGAVREGPHPGQRDWSWPAQTLLRETGPRGVGRPRLRRELRRLAALARASGYVDGEHPLGGAYALHPALVTWLLGGRDRPDHRALAQSRLEEDHLLGLMARAGGFRPAEFSRAGDPMAVVWKGLADRPQALLDGPPLVIHSTEGWGELSEAEVLAFFAAARRRDGTSGVGADGE